MPNFNLINKLPAGLVLFACALVLSACGGGQDYEMPEFEVTPTVTPTYGPEPTSPPDVLEILELGDGYTELDLENAHLEAGEVAPWSQQGGDNIAIDIASNDARDGAYSLAVTGRDNSWNGPTYSTFDATAGTSMLEPNTVYKLAVSGKMLSIAGNAATDTLTFTMKNIFADATEAYIGIGSAEANANDWVDIQGEITTGDYPNLSPALSGQVVYVEAAGATSSFLVDALMIGKKLPPAMEIVNGGFETGDVSPWTKQGDTVLTVVDNSTVDTKDGDYALKVTDRADTWHAPIYPLVQDGTAILTADTNYIFSVYVKLLSADPDTLKLTIKTTPASAGAGGQEYDLVVESAVTLEDGWVLLQGTKNSGDTVAATDKVLYIETAGKTTSFLVDKLTIRPADDPVTAE